jgi:hypothetical protein
MRKQRQGARLNLKALEQYRAKRHRIKTLSVDHAFWEGGSCDEDICIVEQIGPYCSGQKSCVSSQDGQASIQNHSFRRG